MKRAIALLLVLAACPADDVPLAAEIRLGALTRPPPASVGAVTTNRADGVYTITLSQGVALAVGCSETCEDAYGACAAPDLTAGDRTRLDVRPIYRLNGQTGERVLVAKQVGTTTLTVRSTCGAQTYDVQVVARPGGAE